MPTKLRRYWDTACCFGFLQDQAGRQAECARVLHEATAGHCEIVISALTIAEVLFVRGAAEQLPADRQRIRGFFRLECFVVADVDRRIAEQAQELRWDHGIQPKDAIHVATALAVNAHYLETYDSRLLDFSRRLGGDPQLVIQPPGADLDQRARQRDTH